MQDNQIQKLQEIVSNAKSMVFFGGAGVSTESGIPDFRSVDGLYAQKYHNIMPEEIISHHYFVRNAAEFYRFYRDKMLCLDAEPNPAHRKLAEWEQKGILSAVVTQNIDGLHQKAGSQKVYELHGSIHRNYCQKCGKFFDGEYILHSVDVPECDCGGIIKPDVVLYEEGLDNAIVNKAVESIQNADVLIIGGTSLNVYPAAGFIRYFHGKHLVIINRDETPADHLAELCIHEKIGEVFSALD